MDTFIENAHPEECFNEFDDFCEDCQKDVPESDYDQMDGDALASAGFGTDEDYGCFVDDFGF